LLRIIFILLFSFWTYTCHTQCIEESHLPSNDYYDLLTDLKIDPNAINTHQSDDFYLCNTTSEIQNFYIIIAIAKINEVSSNSIEVKSIVNNEMIKSFYIVVKPHSKNKIKVKVNFIEAEKSNILLLSHALTNVKNNLLYEITLSSDDFFQRDFFWSYFCFNCDFTYFLSYT
jgi:hypothetical protein